jgi:alkyl-hydroperoxide reductase/thiol specific antioxidant family protein
VVGVSFAPPAGLLYLERVLALPFPVLTDPSRRMHRTFGLGRASLRRVVGHPRVWLGFVRAVARGRRPRRSGGEDVLQLGGDVLLDADLRLRWIHRNRGPEDHPSIATLAAAIDALAAAPGGG